MIITYKIVVFICNNGCKLTDAAPLKLRPYGAIQICLLLLLLTEREWVQVDTKSTLIVVIKFPHLASRSHFPDNGKREPIFSRIETAQFLTKQARQHRNHLSQHSTINSWPAKMYLCISDNVNARYNLKSSKAYHECKPMHAIKDIHTH